MADFNRSKYQDIFESRYGKGSYDKGLSSAREIGKLKTQGEFAKTQYISAMKKAQEEAIKRAEEEELYGGQSKESYEAQLKAQGKITDQQQKAQQQGRGGHLPNREQINKEKAIQNEYKATGMFPSNIQKMLDNLSFEGVDEANAAYNKERKAKKKDSNILDRLGDLFKGTGRDIMEGAEDAFRVKVLKQNPSDVIKGTVKEYAKDGQKPSKATQEFARTTVRGLNSATGGLIKEGAKDADNKGIQEMFKPRKGAGAVSDFIADSAGYLIPGIGAYKGVRALGLGVKAGSKGIQKVGQLAREGALAGAGISAAEVGIREGLNPDDYNWKDNAALIGLGAGLGAVADPALYGITSIIKGFRPPKAQSQSEQLALPSPQEQLMLPEPQRRLPEPQRQLPAPKAPSFNESFKQPRGLENPIPQMDKTIEKMVNQNQPFGSLAGRLNNLPENRTLPDYSNGRQVSEEISLSERLGRMSPNRKMQDFSYGKPVTESPDTTNVYGVEMPYSAIEHAPPGYWKNRYESFARDVNQNYNVNTLTKEALEDLWSQTARYDEPINLDQLVDLAYKNVNQPSTLDANNFQVNRPSVSGNAKRIMGVDETAFNSPSAGRSIENDIFQPKADPEPIPEQTIKDALQGDDRINEMVKNLFPAKQPISRQATLDEMVERLSSLAPNPKNNDILKPLQFKRTVQPNGNDLLSSLERQGVIKTRKTPASTAISPQVKEIDARIETLESIIRANPKGESTVRPLINALEEEKKAFFTQPNSAAPKPVREKVENISPEPDPGLVKVPNANNVLLKGIDATKLKDVSGFRAYMTDPYRLGEDVFGKDYPKIKKRVFDKFDASKGARIDEEQKWLKALKTDVVDKFNIPKGSKKSALVQKYGEKQITLEELKAKAPKDWKDIVKADKWFRNFYDTMIDEVNAVRAKIYPNNSEMIVPKRSDYYRHFNDLTGFENVKNLFDNSGGIDTSLIGTSEYTKPNSKFLSFAQKRGLGPFKNDAVGGVLNYIRAATYAKHIDPHIPVFKQLQKELANGTSDSKNLTHYLEYLDDFSRDLAGKTNPGDRWIQKTIPGGRAAMGLLHQGNNRIKRNTILMNLGSAIAQGANIPNGMAFAKKYSIQGAGRAMRSVVEDIPEMGRSTFLKERYGDKIYREFDVKWFEQPQKFASWMLETADRIGTSFVWNSAYAKGVAEGAKDAVKYADDATRKLIAGRGIGEVPIAQKAKTFQFLAPFQLEVANLWQVQRDFVKAKDFSAIATLFAGSFLFNKVTEEVRGSKVTFDPIAAMIEASEEGLTPLERGGRLTGEVLLNVPFGQTAAAIYPEYGAKPWGVELPTREELFGDRDPTRFGSSILAVKGIQDPLYKLLPPMGGLQVQKTKRGIESILNEGVYNKGGDKLQYPVEPTLENSLKAALFGPYATDEAKEYFKNERTPLGTAQTQQYENAKEQGKGDEFYNAALMKRLQKNIKTTQSDRELTQEEKDQKITNFLKMMESLKR